jgi:hypothetical protein
VEGVHVFHHGTPFFRFAVARNEKWRRMKHHATNAAQTENRTALLTIMIFPVTS